MSEWRVEVIEVPEIQKHPNADSLGIVNIYGGYPCIVRLNEFKQGDKAIYAPVDSVMPDEPQWEFLGSSKRVKAKRLRGIFSMGLLIQCDQNLSLGLEVTDLLKITKYEPPEPINIGGENEPDPGFPPVYTDIEGLRKWKHLLIPNEAVILTEKIHGANGRAAYFNDRLYVASHHNFKRQTHDPKTETIWWKVAQKYKLEEKLRLIPDYGIYFEVFGQVQDLKYDCKPGELKLVVFDAISHTTRRYLDYDKLLPLCHSIELPCAPRIGYMAWSEELTQHANGKSLIANNCREGFVVRPEHERTCPEIGRVILKMVGEDYMLRKEKSK